MTVSFFDNTLNDSLQVVCIIVYSKIITQPSIKKLNLIITLNNYMASKIQPILLGFGVYFTINRSTMVSYQKIIKGFLKNPLVFKWERFKDF